MTWWDEATAPEAAADSTRRRYVAALDAGRASEYINVVEPVSCEYTHTDSDSGRRPVGPRVGVSTDLVGQPLARNMHSPML